MSVSTVVDKRPPCDFNAAHGEAHFDAKTRHGPWAFMCLACYKQHGIQLGTGFGQRLYLKGEVQ